MNDTKQVAHRYGRRDHEPMPEYIARVGERIATLEAQNAALVDALERMAAATREFIIDLPDGEHPGLGELRLSCRNAEEALTPDATQAAAAFVERIEKLAFDRGRACGIIVQHGPLSEKEREWAMEVARNLPPQKYWDEEIRAEERDACAKVAELAVGEGAGQSRLGATIAAAIRARSSLGEASTVKGAGQTPAKDGVP